MVLKKPVGVIVLAVALGGVLLVTSGMKATAGNRGIFVKGYMIGPPAVEEALPTTHTVVKGENLWNIAGYKHIYGDPTKWPQIYRANRDKIENPDLIYPGQVLVIPR